MDTSDDGDRVLLGDHGLGLAPLVVAGGAPGRSLAGAVTPRGRAGAVNGQPLRPGSAAQLAGELHVP